MRQHQTPPLPPNFVKNFIDGGWRKVERMYGARSDVNRKWLHMAGGDELIAQRRIAKRKRDK